MIKALPVDVYPGFAPVKIPPAAIDPRIMTGYHILFGYQHNQYSVLALQEPTVFSAICRTVLFSFTFATFRRPLARFLTRSSNSDLVNLSSGFSESMYTGRFPLGKDLSVGQSVDG